jgi:hypothetical protein
MAAAGPTQDVFAWTKLPSTKIWRDLVLFDRVAYISIKSARVVERRYNVTRPRRLYHFPTASRRDLTSIPNKGDCQEDQATDHHSLERDLITRTRPMTDSSQERG